MEYLDPMKNLIKKVVKKFYEPHHIVLVNIILENILIYDSELQKKMKISTKEINRLLVSLKEDKIIKLESKVENQEDNRQYLRTVYYINFVEVRDIIKYKIYKITKKIEEDMKNSMKEGYVCKNCDKHFSALDAQCFMSNYIFKCDECGGDLIELQLMSYEDSLNVKFMSSIQDIIELLKDIDKYEIPSMDFFQLSEFKKEISKKDIKVESFKIINEDEFKIKETNEEKQIIHDNHEIDIDDVVYVNGKPKAYKDITDEDKEIMNEEEYEKYFEVFSKYLDNK